MAMTIVYDLQPKNKLLLQSAICNRPEQTEGIQFSVGFSLRVIKCNLIRGKYSELSIRNTLESTPSTAINTLGMNIR